jgi:D-proline reductase (dithiol) PrdB
VGLVARVIEAAGIATVTLQLLWAFQRVIGMPRVAAIEHPFARPFGDVSDAATQRVVLVTALAVFALAREPGHVEHLPVRWPSQLDERESWHPAEPSPISALLRERRRREDKERGGETPSRDFDPKA